MEVVDENEQLIIEGNREHVVVSHVTNDSHLSDPNANESQEPYIGMEFESQENAYSFYAHYAKVIGFGISIKTSRRSKVSREFIDVKYACTRYGKKRESNAINPRPCLKVECEAYLRIKRKSDGKWVVHDFIKHHNHELFPAHARYFPCHRRINKAQQSYIENMQNVGVRTTKIYATMAKQHGGYENIGCLEKDVRNHLDKSRRLSLESGDANAMLECFMAMQEENPRFFYAIDLDDENRVKNVFWVDAKGREDYQEFGDVISFDTTYITNKYKMPFAPFIGVNNHFQSRLLGCALLADETSNTFIWLMKTWLRAMGGNPPNAIITDQDRAMKVAIREVFPNTRHRFCLWHILRKVPEKLSHVLRNNEDFKKHFNSCIYRSWSKKQFEDKWQEMVEKFQLLEDQWLQSLYEEREYWVPVYMKDTFFGGMSTTQRSESINSFFDKYVCKKTTLKEFVEKYKVALHDREEAEMQADFNTWHKQPILKTPSPFEKQMSLIYTHEVFKKFQIEVLGLSGCRLMKENKDNHLTTFEILDFQNNEEFVVEWEASKKEISCLCRLFEFNGYLCRHSLMALLTVGVFAIPSQYILKRWSKDVRSKHHKRKTDEDVCSSKERFDRLHEKSIEFIDEASLSHESYNFACHTLGEALKHCATINQSLKVDKENVGKNNLGDTSLLDPRSSKTKGAPSRRIKSGIEKGRKRHKKES
ncbi:protein far-red impaired response 1-like [Trifolium pratense]|uniref:Protein FAR1-RELATED SEQUENCE n=1 Tax=Trifolium pratense TaxID=57577 RepID=A0A2K3NGL2_TRIPR|nr:protein far-red impaired response 1-like [Trifolium pratense]